MAPKQLVIDRTFLDSDPHPIAVVYRAIKFSRDGLTSREICQRFSATGRWPLQRLIAIGWVARESQRRDIEIGRLIATYRALDDPRPAPSRVQTVGSDLVSARRRLTKIIGMASDARRSGVAFQMGRTLDRIECELREVRDSLTLSRKRESA